MRHDPYPRASSSIEVGEQIVGDIDFPIKKPNPFHRGGSVMYQSETLIDPLTSMHPTNRVHEDNP